MRVIAIHGAAVNAAAWTPVQRLLERTTTLIADDLPGHGTRRAEPFVFATAVDEIVAAARNAGPGAVLVGESLGGYLALAAAARLGRTIAGVVAGSCTFAMRGWAGRMARLSLPLGAMVPPAALRAILYRICEPDVASEIEVRGLAPAMRNETLRALIGYDVLADVRAVRVPIAFIVGGYDVPIVWNATRFARAAAVGTVLVEPNAPHLLAVMRPAAFARAIVSIGSGNGDAELV